MRRLLVLGFSLWLLGGNAFAAGGVFIQDANNVGNTATVNSDGSINVRPSSPSGTQDANIKQVNGQTVNVGTGAAGTGTLRVSTSTDSTVATVTNPVGIKGGDGSTINGAANATYVQPGTNAVFSVSPSVTSFEFSTGNTPTVQNAAYSSGNCISGFQTATVSRVAGGGVVLTGFSVRSVTGITPTLQVYIFDANPSASTCTDKSTFTINSADISKIPPGGTFQITLAVPTGSTPSFGSATALNLNMIAGGSTASGVSTIYYALVATASTTPGSTTDLQVKLNGLQD